VEQTVIITTWTSLIVLHHITPTQSLHRLTAQPSGPCELYTAWFPYCTTPFVHSKNRGQGKKTHPTPHTMCHKHWPPHLTKTSHHTCKYKVVSYPSTPLPVSTHNNPLFIHSIWFAEQTHSLRENTLTGSHCQITDIPAYYATSL